MRNYLLICSTLLSFINSIGAHVLTKDSNKEHHFKSVETVSVSINILNDILTSDAHVFLYLPEMEDPNFSYRRDIMGDNNFLGLLHIDNIVHIPKSVTNNEFTELLIKAKGYQLQRIRYSPDISHYNVKLEPLGIVTDTVYLRKKKIERIDRDISFCEPITTKKGIREDQFFYGECNPIYYSDGGHGDPYCAFSDNF